MSREERKVRLIGFLDGICRPERSLRDIRDDDELIRSGVIDSLGVLAIIQFLEAEHGISFEARGVSPGELSTIEAILNLIERESDRATGQAR